MKRKLVKQGNNALTISLPSDWTKAGNLAAGDEVDIEVVGKNIVIGSSLKAVEKYGEVDLSGKDPMIKRILGAMYKSGYDQITARFETAKEYEIIQTLVREEFMGFQIVHHEKNSVVIRGVSQLEIEEFDMMLRRMFLIIKSVGDDLIEAQKSKDEDFLRIIYLRDKDVNKLSDILRRLINKYIGTSQNLVGPHYFIIEQLEKIGDYYRDIAKYLMEKKTKLSPETVALLKKTNQFYDLFYQMYFKIDLDKMAEFGKMRVKLNSEIEDRLSKQPSDGRIVAYILSLSESIFDLNGPLMTLKI